MSQLPTTTNHNQNGTIICGDINARNKQLLGDKKDTNRGLYLNNFMIENGFQCLNSTYAYDLFLCNEPLDQVSMQVHNEAGLDSDHRPVSITFVLPSNVPTIPPQNHPRRLWKLGKLTDQDKLEQYKNLCQINIEPIHNQITDFLDDNNIQPDLDQLTADLNFCIHNALDNSVGISHPIKTGNKWFWNDDLERAFQQREHCYRQWTRHTGFLKAEWYDKHQAAAINFKSLVRQRKYTTWREFTHKLLTDDFAHTTATIKRIRQHRTKSQPFSDPSGPAVAATTMARHLETVFASQYLPNIRAGLPPRPSGPHPIDDDCPFTIDTIEDALKSVARKKAPGLDHLRAEIPISLTSVLRKVMEICLSPSLHSDSLPLDVAQGGFRQQRSTLDQVLCLHELSIRHTRITGQSPSICVLDILSAYDTVDHSVIWHVLECDVPPLLLGLLQSLFDDVHIEVLISGHVSYHFSPTTGVLQGSILSPHLYSLYINSLPQILCAPLFSSDSDSDSDFLPSSLYSSSTRPIAGHWINALLYPDDVILIASPDIMQSLLDHAEQHSLQLGYRWNPTKCIAINAASSSSPPLTLYNQPLISASTFIYLGIPFTNKGTIDTPLLIERNITSTLHSMRVLHQLGCSPAGFPCHLSIQLYKRFIRPKFEYGLAIARFRQIDAKRLNRAQDNCLRMLFGGHSKASIIVFRHMGNIPTTGFCFRSRPRTENFHLRAFFFHLRPLNLRQRAGNFRLRTRYFRQ
ncbi:hypothetical protein INT45_008179 [Circinella minor]|uniref:Reverse transcriptase domain-containing protein n=1 Tax=Circinella minor TaxID=1195481 RepID=A0A8H7V8I5_9FUNG|nr:hypothetical protein INT45_008179 [Circinella minor]